MKIIKQLTAIIVGCWVSLCSFAYELPFEEGRWQLVSFPSLPQDNTVEAVFSDSALNRDVESIWTFDNESKSWARWPHDAQMPVDTISELETGQGYWVHSNKDFVLSVEGGSITQGGQTLYPGWNLIGVTSESDIPHEQALAGVPFLELWSYNINNNGFQVVRKSGGSQIIIEEQFLQVESGKGYWAYVTEQTSLIPSLGTLLPPDVDVEPLLTIPQYGRETPWVNVTPGDIDWDGDGFFDFPNTQQTVAFGDFLNRQRLAITNEGNGVLSWQATIEPAVDWLLFEAFDEDGNPVLTNNAIGNVSDTNGELVMVVNRVGLAPGDNYNTQIVLRANGDVAEKRIDVSLAVADVVGDYEFTVRLDEVDGKTADLHNPKYFVSFARDGQGVKAFIDEKRSLLIPETTYLSGSYIGNPESHFQVLGQLYLPQGHAHNPYQSDIRREFTIIGQRSDGRDGLSPLDLKGTYSENIYGIFDQPIQLTGEFVGIRLSPLPEKQDNTISERFSGDIVSRSENGGESLFHYNFNERYSITDIKTALEIDHPQPEALKIELISPQRIIRVNNSEQRVRTTALLHDLQQRSLKNVQFDDHDRAVDSMDIFDGQIARGQWTLKITNTSDSVGRLNGWTVDISGANVYQIRGVTAPGVRLQLTGCGIVRSTISDRNSGEFVFDGLIPCDYEISVVQLGYEVTSTSVRIDGCLKTVANQCQELNDYIINLSDIQLAELQPRLSTEAGKMRVVISPLQSILPVNNEETLAIQAVDVTDYQSLGQTLLNRHWQLFRRAVVSGSDVLVASQSTSVTSGSGAGASWNHEFNGKPENAGIYYVRLTSQVRNNGNNTTANANYQTKDVSLAYQATDGVHLAAYSNYAAAGTPMIKAMDMATFDINRPPLDRNNGPEDSDSFKADIDEATQTNATNSVFENPLNPGQFSFTPSGFDQPQGNPRNHYRLHISTGQLIHGPSAYGGDFRMDMGIQSAQTDATEESR